MRELKEAIARYDASRVIVADATLDFKEFSVAIGVRERALHQIVAVARRVVAENEGSFE